MAASQSTPGTQDKDKVARDLRVAEGTQLSWQARFDGLVKAPSHWRPEDREKFGFLVFGNIFGSESEFPSTGEEIQNCWHSLGSHSQSWDNLAKH